MQIRRHLIERFRTNVQSLLRVNGIRFADTSKLCPQLIRLFSASIIISSPNYCYITRTASLPENHLSFRNAGSYVG